MSMLLDTDVNAKYNKKICICGFQPGHLYTIFVDSQSHGYEVNGTYDLTDEKSVDLLIKISSLSSLNDYFSEVS